MSAGHLFLNIKEFIEISVVKIKKLKKTHLTLSFSNKLTSSEVVPQICYNLKLFIKFSNSYHLYLRQSINIILAISDKNKINVVI